MGRKNVRLLKGKKSGTLSNFEISPSSRSLQVTPLRSRPQSANCSLASTPEHAIRVGVGHKDARADGPCLQACADEKLIVESAGLLATMSSENQDGMRSSDSKEERKKLLKGFEYGEKSTRNIVQSSGGLNSFLSFFNFNSCRPQIHQGSFDEEIRISEFDFNKNNNNNNNNNHESTSIYDNKVTSADIKTSVHKSFKQSPFCNESSPTENEKLSKMRNSSFLIQSSRPKTSTTIEMRNRNSNFISDESLSETRSSNLLDSNIWTSGGPTLSTPYFGRADNSNQSSSYSVLDNNILNSEVLNSSAHTFEQPEENIFSSNLIPQEIDRYQNNNEIKYYYSKSSADQIIRPNFIVDPTHASPGSLSQESSFGKTNSYIQSSSGLISSTCSIPVSGGTATSSDSYCLPAGVLSTESLEPSSPFSKQKLTISNSSQSIFNIQKKKKELKKGCLLSDESFEIYFELQNQNKPLGFGRWTLLTVFTILLFFNGPIFFNWPPLRDFLAKGGVYSSECSAEDTLDSDGLCSGQRNKLQLINNVGTSSMFIGSALGGMMLDLLGPKWTGVIGSLESLLGFSLCALSSPQLNLYMLGFGLIGLGVEPVMFSLFDFGFLFPRRQSTIISILSAGRGLAFAYPIFFSWMAQTHSVFAVFWTAALIAGSCSVILAVSVPRLPYLSEEQYASKTLLASTSPLRQRQSNSSNECSSQILELIDDPETRSVQNLHLQPPLEKIKKNNNNNSACYTVEFGNKKMRSKGKRKSDLKEFFSAVFSLRYGPWIPFFSIAVFRANFFGAELSDAMTAAADFYTIVSPLAFILCPLLGYLADRFGIFVIILSLNILSLAAFICPLISTESNISNYLAVLFFWPVIAFLVSQSYIFVSQCFPQNLMGKLAGFAMAVGGLLSLATTPLYSFANSHKAFHIANGIVVGLTLLNFLFLVPIYYSHRKLGLIGSKKSFPVEQTVEMKS